MINAREWSGPVGVRLAIPTPDPLSLDGEPVHPSIVYVDEGWCGYRYWMAFTPYAGGNDRYEDPCIVVSQDGDTWSTPPGLTNPLDDAPGSPIYNSDPYLVLDGDTLRLIWRRFDDTAPGAEESLWMRTSTDGVTWAPKVKIYESDKAIRRLASPSFVELGGVWHMFAVDLRSTGTQVVHLTAPAITGPWSTPTVSTLPVAAGKMPWHMHVQRVGSQYVALVADTLTGGTGAREGDLLLATSDDGDTWTTSAPVVPRYGEHHTDLYQAAFVVDERGIDVWYSARITGSPSVWSILRTRLTLDDPRRPYATASGTVAFGVVPAGGSAAAGVTFPQGRFTRTPVVTVSSANGRISPGTSGLTRDSVTIKAFNWTGANATNPVLHWSATQHDR